MGVSWKSNKTLTYNIPSSSNPYMAAIQRGLITIPIQTFFIATDAYGAYVCNGLLSDEPTVYKLFKWFCQGAFGLGILNHVHDVSVLFDFQETPIVAKNPLFYLFNKDTCDTTLSKLINNTFIKLPVVSRSVYLLYRILNSAEMTWQNKTLMSVMFCVMFGVGRKGEASLRLSAEWNKYHGLFHLIHHCVFLSLLDMYLQPSSKIPETTSKKET